MRRRVIGVVATVALLAALVAVLDPVDRWLTRRATDLSLHVETLEGEPVRIAHGTLLDREDQPLATLSLTGRTWTVTGAPDDPAWGRRAAAVHLDAFGCRVEAPLAAREEVTGSPLGSLAAHPNPRRVTHRLEGTLACDALPPGEGLPLAVLLAALDAESEELRGAAVDELTRIGFAAAPAVPRLAELAAGAEGGRARCPAARALAAIGPPAAEAVPALAGLATADDPGQVRCAVRALERIGPAFPGVVVALAGVLAHEHPDAREEAARALGRLGPGTEAAVPELIERLLDEEEDQEVRLATFSALKLIGTPEAREAMRRYAERHPILY